MPVWEEAKSRWIVGVMIKVQRGTIRLMTLITCAETAERQHLKSGVDEWKSHLTYTRKYTGRQTKC